MLCLETRTKRKLVWVAALFAPLLAVQGVRLLSTGQTAPSAAEAAEEHTPAPIVQPAQPLSAAEQRALAWLRSKPQSLNLRSPMDRPDPQPTPTAPEPVAPAEPSAAPPPTDDTPTDLVVTTIMGTADRALASINHRACRVGEQVAPGWTVRSINVRDRRVVLVATDGRELILEQSPSR